jgi:hypothetical protein
MRLRPELDPDDLKQKAGRPSNHSPDDLLPFLESGKMTTTQWQKRAQEEGGISQSTFHRLKKCLQAQGFVAKDPDDTWVKAG